MARILQIDSVNVTLKLEQNNQCSDCESHCSDGFLGFFFNKNKDNILTVGRTNQETHVYHLEDKQQFFKGGYKENDVIGLKFDEYQLLKLALSLYGVPVLFVFVFLLLGYYLFSILNLGADLGGILGMIVGLILSKFVIKLNYIKFKPKVKFFK